LRRVLHLLSWLVVTAAVGLVIAGAGLVYVIHEYGEDLPDYRQLAEYQPPTVTRIHAGDGRLLAEYAHERRVFVPIEAIPQKVKHAFIAAEDKNFYDHFGIDPLSVVRAVVDNIQRLRDDRRPQGASTITQQVAKNFLLTNELSLERKIKEAILAIRIERAFAKDHILELYLNEIFLGLRSYGVAAAALNYFDKSLDELTIAEAAYLAGLPKAPSRYHPEDEPETARARRGYVIGRMLEDGYITEEEAAEARAAPLTLRSRAEADYARAAFFTEEVRRQLVDRFGEEGFYGGGLSVRTTVEPELQTIARRALREGLAAYDRRQRRWRGPLANIDLEATADWQDAVATFDPGFDPGAWQVAAVLELHPAEAVIGLASGDTAFLPLEEVRWARPVDENGRVGPEPSRMSQVVSEGDMILVEEVTDEEGGDSRFTLRQRPEVEGAVVAIDPHTGRVLAMAGGFSFRQSQFNRATQAMRQPGSAFKPFVYLAALEAGKTPSSIVLDAPLVVDQGPGLPKWKPVNYGDRFYGPSTLRLGLEKSRNLMTVRLAQDIGMDKVQDVAQRFGIGENVGANLASALGSNDVDLLSLTTAYAMLVNGGRRIEPALVERIQDRFGRTVMRRDERPCEGCRAVAWDGGPPPEIPDDRPYVADPRHAYQLVHMLEGVIERGTGRRASAIGKPLAGKTGTTNESRDAWFVGFSPDLAAGVFVGYDQPQSMGRETGSSLALPIWQDFMAVALEDAPATPFRTPAGVRLVRVDAESGLLPGPTTDKVIAEAFLPGTEPSRRTPGRVAQGEGGAAEGGSDSGGGGSSLPGSGGLY